MSDILGQGGQDYPAQTASYPGEKLVRMPNMRERLDMAVRQAEQRLADAKRAREIFDKNPDLEELVNLMQKGNF